MLPVSCTVESDLEIINIVIKYYERKERNSYFMSGVEWR